MWFIFVILGKKAKNKKSLAYKIAKYDIQDESLALFVCLWVLILLAVYVPSALDDGSAESLGLWLAGASCVLVFAALNFIKLRIKLRQASTKRSRR